MKLKILIINTGHFIVINSRVILYTEISLISLTQWKYKTNMPICYLGYHTTSSYVNVFRHIYNAFES